MNEYTSRDTRFLRQLGVAESAPALGERLAVDKAVGRLGDTLDAPFRVRVLGTLGVEDEQDLDVRFELGLNREEVVLPWCGLTLVVFSM